jgi:hypothetical protein
VGKPDLSPLGANKHAVKVFEDMLAREKSHAGEWAVFYHSYNSPALVYEVQAAVAKVLFRFGSKHGVLPRLLKQPFEKLGNAAAVLKAFPSWPDKDHNPAFKSVGICCSTSLVSSDPEATPSQVFLNGYGASTVTIAVVEKLLRDCGTPSKTVSSLAKTVMDLASKHGLPQATGKGQQGHLLQIFIHRSCVDHWAYASLPYGVLDKPRHPLSKHLETKSKIVGQARVVTNPSAFMRAKSIRLHACSADETYHQNRPAFQDALFEALAPILGSPEVRLQAAKGVYGGKLPSWWRDLETEKAEKAAAEKAAAEKAAAEKAAAAKAAAGKASAEKAALEKASADKASTGRDAATATDDKLVTAADDVAPTRVRCRYGAQCMRKNAEHFSEFVHPGDADWTDIDTKTCVLTAPLIAPTRRPCCRYSAGCYRNGADHRSTFAHAGDSDWTDSADVNMEKDRSTEQSMGAKTLTAAGA